MLRRLRICVALCLVALITTARAAEGGADYVGRAVADVLKELQDAGLKIVFSSELVRPDLKVTIEPRSKTPRRILDEVLKPHGLEVRAAAAGTLVVVKSRPSSRQSTKATIALGSVSGRVVDATTGNGLPGVDVQVQSSAQSTVTDADGAFLLPGIEAGRQALFVSTIGYALGRPEVDVPAGSTVGITVPLAEGTGAYTDRVVVTADVASEPVTSAPVIETLTSAGLQSVRNVMIDDPIRAVQAMPGVAANDDFRSDFSVRGSGFTHVGLSIDGVSTPWLLHGFEGVGDSGSMAILNSDILERVSLAFGAYPQRYADRTGAWLEATVREGSRAKTGIRGSVSGTSASLLAEGPLGSDARGAWLVSARRSYIDWLVRRVVPAFDAVFSFSDVQSKTVYDLSPRHQIQILAIGGRSRLQTEDTSPNDAEHAADDLVLGAVALRSTVTPTFLVTQRVAGVGQQFRNINAYGVENGRGDGRSLSYRVEASWSVRRNLMLESGGQFEHQRSTRTTALFFTPVQGSTLTATRTELVDGDNDVASAFLHAALSLRRTSIAGGARVTDATAPDARFVSSWAETATPLADSLTLRVGAGLSHQLPAIDQLFGPHAGTALRPERATTVDVALDQQLRAGLRWQLSLYHRDEDGFLAPRNAEFRLRDGQFAFPDPDYRWENALDGESHGLELSVRHQRQLGLSGWASYGFSRTKYRDVSTGEQFDGDFDQRHTVNVFAQYALSNRTSFSTKLRLGSNYPVPGYWTERGPFLVPSDQRNDVRLPAYARLDLRANRVYNYTKRRLTLFVEVMNVLNRANVRAVSPDSIVVRGRSSSVTATNYVQELFPLLPSAGLLIEF